MRLVRSFRETLALSVWLLFAVAPGWVSAEDTPPSATPESAAGEETAQNWIRRLTVPEYIETVRSSLGVDIARDARRLLPRDLRADGFSNTAYSLNVDLAHVEAYATLARMIASRIDVMALAAEHAATDDLKGRLLDSGAQLSEAELRDAIAGTGKWILRGPLEASELDAFVGVATAVRAQEGDSAEALRYVVEAMLQSPRFLYRIERQQRDGTPQRVVGFELASRLSYTLWGGPPDRELMRAAEAGELADHSRVESQVRRMLADPRAVTRSRQFIHEWLNLGRLAALRPDPGHFPNWSDELAADMRDETLAFFEDIAWKQQRPLWELLNADVTFATPRLAEHYGLDRTLASGAADWTPGLSSSLESEGPAERTAHSSGRITDSLLALYTFLENGGQTIHDMSQSGEPLTLEISDESAVRWSEAGLTLHAPTLIASEQPPARLINAIRESQAMTLEAWITPANASQAGPARIVTLSADTQQRDFTLGQDGDKYDVRFRTTETSANGLPSLTAPAGSVEIRTTHVVYTRDADGKGTLYVDGQERATGRVAGDLSNWDGGLRLAVANELTQDRPWLGTLHLVAIYGRALSPEEVSQNHAAGASPMTTNDVVRAEARAGRDERGLEALYTFDEAEGDTVRDMSGNSEPLDLRLENTEAVSRESGRLTINGTTLVATPGPAQRLTEAIQRSRGLTLEVWIAPGEMSQTGPARILTLSSGIGERNFTLGQDGDRFDVRFRGANTDANGIPSLSTPGGAVQTRLTQVVFTRDAAGQARLYVDGAEQATHEVAGDLSNWNSGYRLAIGNETSKDRTWLGTYHRVAIYSRALSPAEIRSDSGLARYDLASVPARGGLLTQGSLLTIGGDEASMVTRGLFVLNDLLFSQVGDPPPCVDTTPVPTKPGMSQRGIAEARLADASCGGCHAEFEPLAFSLEKFDGIGAFHEVDRHGNQLREDGQVLLPGDDAPAAYQTIGEFMDLLAGSQRVRMGITRKLTQFAIGRPLVATDEPILDKIHATAVETGGTYQALITAIVLSDLVQMTGTEHGADDH